MTVKSLISNLPKAELHLHIEGTLEPQLMWDLAKKHGVTLPYDSVQAIVDAYEFDDLQSFLDLYYQGADVLKDEDDFYQLMRAYFVRCKQDNIVHAEIMFDPQTHTVRGVPFAAMMSGFKRAMQEAETEMEISSLLIMSFLRHLSEEDAFATLQAALPFKQDISAIGLDSSEAGNPPNKFKRVFKEAQALGFKTVAHAGEEGPASYVWQALSELNVDRIDHGVRAADDAKLMAYLKQRQMALTVCPLSNVKLNVFSSMEQHNILALLNEGVSVTVNSDDPSYFGGYLNDNYRALQEHLDMSAAQCVQLVKNSIVASFLSDEQKQRWLSEIERISDGAAAA